MDVQMNFSQNIMQCQTFQSLEFHDVCFGVKCIPELAYNLSQAGSHRGVDKTELGCEKLIEEFKEQYKTQKNIILCIFGSIFPAQCCIPWHHISSLSSFMHTFHCTTLNRLSDEGCINYYYFTVSSEVNQKSRILLYTVLKSSFSIHSTMFAMSDRSGWPVHVQTFSSLTVSNAMAVLWKQKYETM